jgi:hypothetical protein
MVSVVPARSIAPLAATVPSSMAETEPNDLLMLPIGVRAALTMYTSYEEVRSTQYHDASLYANIHEPVQRHVAW